jgi:hypothetical protein
MLSAALLPAVAGEAGAMTQQQYQKYKQNILRDPSLIRLYTFEEGRGEEVTNHVLLDPSRIASSGGTLGSLGLDRPSVEDVVTNEYASPKDYLPGKLISPDWTVGRWPWKAAISSGLDRAKNPVLATKLFRSGITGVEFNNGGSLSAWIRIHENESTYESCNIFTLGDAWGNGFSLRWSESANEPNGVLNFKLGSDVDSLRRTQVSADSCLEGVWHHVVVTFDGATVQIYLDGVLKNKADFYNKVVPTTFQDYPQVRPFQENSSPSRWGSYFMIAHNPAKEGQLNSQFDIDELAIYNRALSAEEVSAIEQTGRPSMTPDEQLAQYHSQAAHQQIRDQIRLEVPYDTGGYFRIGQSVPVHVDIPEATGLKGEFKAVIETETIYGKPIQKLECLVIPGRSVTEQLQFEKCGAYYVDIQLLDKDGNLVKRLSRKYGIGIVPPAPAKLTEHNPVAFWANWEDRFYYDAPIRRMNYGKAASFEQNYANYERLIPNFRAFVWFYSGMSLKPEVIEKNKKLFSEAVDVIKDKNVFGLEVTSEPHTTDYKGYVEMLRMVTETFKEKMPDIQIFPPGGAPPSIPMIAEILKAGGIKYVDGVSYHPYTGNPINTFLWNNPAKRLKDVLALYPEKKLTLWATENAINSLPRLRGRPMTREQANAAAFPSYTNAGHQSFAAFVAMIPEDEAAALQCHDILLKLVDGYKLYTVHVTPNVSLIKPEMGVLPGLKGVAITALAGQVLNNQIEVTRLPLASVENMCVLIKNTDNTTTAAIFSMQPATVSFKAEPNTEYRTMDMLGNYSQIRSNPDGLITIKSEKAPQYIFGVPTSLAEVVPLMLKAPSVLPDNGILNGTIEVKNPFSTALSATLTAQELTGASITLERNSVNLAPGESVSIAIQLKSEFLKRRSYLLGVEMKNNTGEVIAVGQQIFESKGVLQMVPQVTNPIKLDGDLSDWEGVPAVVYDDEESVVHGKPNRAEIWQPQWENAEDLSLSIQTAWRKDDGIYFLLKVRDNVLLPAPDDQVGLAFRYDCLEFFFDSRVFAEQGTAISAGADQVVVVPQIGESAKPCVLWYAKKDENHVQLECVGRKTKDGYLIEGRITPTDHSQFRIRAGSQFRMDLLVDDTDKLDSKWMRKSAMALHGQMSNFTNSDIWGRYELSLGGKK